ncbi:hypothetical protein AQUCO_00200163v1 [Aquilegia coerulea]|uniref:Uncharacterized protein n=1 Tax=Aquilegia coerulea TaxID=218851 RepID=A0A2G5F1Z1_AQUCA|nr:hypothetical protein AQUCO_00200163v1 [Aquilegia coerulea]
MATKSFIFCFLLICSSLILPSDATFRFPRNRFGNWRFRFPVIPVGNRFRTRCDYNAIYQFGDSISDTGNLIREGPAGSFTPFAHLPYGETTFGEATGRCSNGLLMIDFLANALHLPLLNPYLDKDASFSQGVNFAVAGSTALQTERLLENRILSPVTNSSLAVQYNWFLDHLKSICSTQTDCARILGQALFMVGETGGNDFNYALLQGKTIQETQSLVPDVVQNIIDLARKLINLGAKRLVIPGNFPIGCFPIYLTAFKTNDTSAYDDKNCLKDLNAFALYQNQYLQRAIQQLRIEHPGVVILYADYYTAFQSVFRRASQLGFDEASTQKACCGSGGDYNFSLQKMCGMPGVSACSNPDQHISWDGIHPTQATYQQMAESLITGLSIFHCY